MPYNQRYPKLDERATESELDKYTRFSKEVKLECHDTGIQNELVSRIKELHDQNAELENVNNELHDIIERLNNDSLNIQHRNKSLETKIVILYDDVKRLKSELLRKSSS